MNNNASLPAVCCICVSLSCAFLTVLPIQLSAQEFFPANCYGGKQQYKDFLDFHMIYPRSELAAGINGSVSLAFDIDKKGSTSEVKILQTSGPAFSDETLRLFSLLLWTPASNRGKEVNDHQDLTINFNSKHYSKTCRLRGYDTIAYSYRPVDTTLKIYPYRLTKKAPEPIFTKDGITLQSFIADNFNYPEAALKQNVAGIVKVRFVVETYGIISNVTVDNHLGAGCTEEAIRLVKLIRWNPGIVNGKAVRVDMNLSITFGLNKKNGIQNQTN